MPAPRRLFRFDLSWPILIAFAAVLCLLIVLPMSWLVYYSFTDRGGAFTLNNFRELIVNPIFVDPLVTTVILATSSSAICCSIAAPVAGYRACAGDGVVRDPAFSRRHRLGIAGGAEQRAAQQDLPRHDRRRAR
jgi:ABC-type spermidine/putrescine transport system permease subunit I